MVDQVQEIKEKVDIVSVISEHIKLKKAGKNYKAPCPFHSEKTPSFIVSPDIGRYKCFGCGKSGDVFTFLEEYDGMEFRDALEFLAQRVGVKLERRKGASNEKKKAYEVLSLLSDYYHYLLTKHPAGNVARDYIKKRNLSTETVTHFKIGFAPQNQSIFTSFFLKKKNIKPKLLESVGQAYVRGNMVKDRFAGRIMFPLANHRGDIVGFSGRILPQYDAGQVGKYINTPETPYYHKSHMLYGLDKVKGDIRESKKVILVEGELDFLSLWQAGFTNTVAVKGTALTEEQARLLARFAETVIFALDGDTAGDAAARRGISIAEKEGLEVKVLELVDAKDPDEAVQKDKKQFAKLLSSAQPAWDYLIESAVKRFGTTGRGKALISKELVPILSSIEDTIVRAHYVGIVAKKLGVPNEAVYEELRVKKFTYENSPKREEIQINEEPKKQSRRDILEKRFVALLLNSSELYEITEGIEGLVKSRTLNKLLEVYKKQNGKKFDLKQFSEQLKPELHDILGDIALDESLLSDTITQKEIEMVENELRILHVKEQLASLGHQINEFERAKDEEKLRSAQEKFRELSERLSALQQV